MYLTTLLILFFILVIINLFSEEDKKEYILSLFKTMVLTICGIFVVKFFIWSWVIALITLIVTIFILACIFFVKEKEYESLVAWILFNVIFYLVVISLLYHRGMF
jgi:hypothetical protein